MRAIMLFVVLALLLGCTACSKEDLAPPPDKKIMNVVRILKHEPRHWTVVVQDPQTKIMTEQEIWIHVQDYQVQYIPDVAEGQYRWVVLKQKPRGATVDTVAVDFHVCSEQDINGAGWNHGKFGSGQTIVVQ